MKRVAPFMGAGQVHAKAEKRFGNADFFSSKMKVRSLLRAFDRHIAKVSKLRTICSDTEMVVTECMNNLSNTFSSKWYVGVRTFHGRFIIATDIDVLVFFMRFFFSWDRRVDAQHVWGHGISFRKEMSKLYCCSEAPIPKWRPYHSRGCQRYLQ